MRVEICVESVNGVRIAEQVGADRIELCGGLSDGGLTPSIGLLEHAIAATTKTQVHVLIRPRPGDFVYTRDEIELMVRDIAAARVAGADGVVVGALDGSGAVDPACAAFVAAAEHLDITFHRAIDVSASSQRTLDQVIDLGFTRVLTAGRERAVLDGAAVIKDLVERAAGALDVMACGGVRPSNAVAALEATGVADLHAAMRTPVPGAEGSAALFAGAGVPQGFDRFDTDPAEAAELCRLVHGRRRAE
ncbi:copper homeostasis protein CutC [Nocardia brasiliensis]|uniref:copper homeostasis protein CutC n=1 Tax=Nocardia brasiliensis TaxID=37326 RepID=UPI002458F6A9|nr:copper homeostasis protein CutC [Nocardia brasiliensis]